MVLSPAWLLTGVASSTPTHSKAWVSTSVSHGSDVHAAPPTSHVSSRRLPGYVYAVNGDDVYVNLFMSNTGNLKVNGKDVVISQQTNYPWNGNIAFTVDKNKAGNFDLKLRIPRWVQNRPVPSDLYKYSGGKRLGYTVTVNGKPADGTLTAGGYYSIARNWKKGDKVELHLDMEPRTVKADNRVEADRGRIAVERGPIVYCAEWYLTMTLTCSAYS